MGVDPEWQNEEKTLMMEITQ